MNIPLRSPWTLVLSLALLLACQADSTTSAPEPAAGDTRDNTGPPSEKRGLKRVEIGPWADYPAPKETEWPTEPLTLKSWATASAELACAGRAFLGDPKKQRRASQRILNYHNTTANDVMAYGISLNADPEHALTMGDLVAGAAERCR